jgi:hypothetical protein
VVRTEIDHWATTDWIPFMVREMKCKLNSVEYGKGTGATIEEVTETLRNAIAEHIEILREMGEEIPVSSSRSGVIQVAS